MNDIFINIKISDRTYSLKINPKDEAILRKAGKVIEQKIQDRREKLGVKDKQDLLAMITFDTVVESLKNNELHNKLTSKLELIDRELSEAIK